MAPDRSSTTNAWFIAGGCGLGLAAVLALRRPEEQAAAPPARLRPVPETPVSFPEDPEELRRELSRVLLADLDIATARKLEEESAAFAIYISLPLPRPGEATGARLARFFWIFPVRRSREESECELDIAAGSVLGRLLPACRSLEPSTEPARHPRHSQIALYVTGRNALWISCMLSGEPP